MNFMYEKALKHLDSGEFKEAERALQAYLEDNPQDAMAYNKLGLIYAKIKQWDKAKAYFSEALKINPQLVHALNNLGNIARQEGDLVRAKEYYEKALEVDPTFSAPHNNLAIVNKQLRRFPGILSELALVLSQGRQGESGTIFIKLRRLLGLEKEER